MKGDARIIEILNEVLTAINQYFSPMEILPRRCTLGMPSRNSTR
jgi:hypothetical protein